MTRKSKRGPGRNVEGVREPSPPRLRDDDDSPPPPPPAADEPPEKSPPPSPPVAGSIVEPPEKSPPQQESSKSLGEDDSETESDEEIVKEQTNRRVAPAVPSVPSSSRNQEVQTGVIAPTEFYLHESNYGKTIKIATRCYIAKAVETIEEILDANEKEWFYSHPQFSHFFHMARDPNHKAMGMWMLLLRMIHTQKKKEAWFVVNGVPIRYSMREHCLISGLHYHPYPEKYKEIGSLAFADKHFGKGKKVTQELVETKFKSMKKPTKDRLKMAILYFLCMVIKGSDKTGKQASAIDPFLKTISSEPDACKTFPWGRFTFLDSMKEIARLMRVFKDGIANSNARFTSFITPLELLAFEAIPCLRDEFRDEVVAEKTCPRMCKSTFKLGSMRGFPIDDINTCLGETKEIESIIHPTLEERHLLDHLEEEDDVVCPVVDGWTKRLVEEDQPVFFEEVFKDDIEARSMDPKEVALKKKKGESSKSDKDKGEGFEVKGLIDLKEMMEAGFKGIHEKLDSMDGRMKKVESFVRSVDVFVDDPSAVIRMGMRNVDGNDGVGVNDGVDLLATAAASKVTGEAQEKGAEDEDAQEKRAEIADEAQEKGAENENAQDEEHEDGDDAPKEAPKKRGRKKDKSDGGALYERPRTRQRTNDDTGKEAK